MSDRWPSDELRQIAEKLDRELRKKVPTFVGVGVGMTEKGPTLYVYVKKLAQKKDVYSDKEYEGYPVIVREMPTILPAEK